MYADAHCHLTAPLFADRAAALTANWSSGGISRFLQGGVDPSEWRAQIALRQTVGAGILAAFGLHPWTVARRTDAELAPMLDELAKLVTGPDRPAALGETGLDFAVAGGGAAKRRQREWFERQLALAGSSQLPVVLHVVKAHGAAQEILTSHSALACRCMVHSFEGDSNTLRGWLRLGCRISISPRSLRKCGAQALAAVPPESLLLESDAPWCGSRDTNQNGVNGATDTNATPLAIFAVAAALAAVTGRPADELLTRSTANLDMFLGHQITATRTP